MNPQLWQQVRATFEQAVNLAGAEREALLDRTVGRDNEVRAAVDRMLRVEPETEGYLEPPSAELLARRGALLPAAPTVGAQVGDYQVVRPLGHGGMGTVYEAVQLEPRRTVAVKVMRWSLASPTAVRRFRYESELLARLQHPGIAQVYAAGVLADGAIETPWFAMEFVADAQPLLEHVRGAGLDLQARLLLFQSVCAAVHHGHQRGVIHRDLKSSNILVGADGQAKVIDFGIARATDADTDAGQRLTRDGALVGTPDCMSPEQIAGGAAVDVRTDVYSLGLVLYQLLCGRFPYDLAGRALVEKGRIICEVEPPPPSSHAPELPRELDWITARAMAKDPERRYGTVQELLDDLQRFRDHQPVRAGRPSRTYALRKFLRRHRVAVAACCLLLAAAIAGLIGTLGFAVQAAAAQRTALQHLRRFDHLAVLARLHEAERAAADLQPAWPERIAELERWLQQRAQPLLASARGLADALTELRRDALPATAAQLAAWRQQHPRAGELPGLRRQLAAWERAQAVRTGGGDPGPPALTPAPDPGAADAMTLAAQALARTSPHRSPSACGDEALGLTLARQALARATPADRDHALLVLAWALHQNGLDAEAESVATQLDATIPGPTAIQRRSLRLLRAALADARSGATAAAIVAARRRLAALESDVAAHRQWRFAAAGDQFLHDTLDDLLAGLQRFAGDLVPAMEQRLAWARRLAEAEHAHAGRWLAARAAIAAPDGATASGHYRQQPIDLQPQPGLVPIGRNPATGLWEFYDLRSAADPGQIPEHAPDGTIRFTAETGIVFVLVPGGTFVMGSNPRPPRRDRWAIADESPLLAVTLAPFLIARTELTQGQWRRLSGGDAPSAFHPEYSYENRDTPVDDSHPVEQVSWFDCRDLLHRHGCDLPTEAQWEYAARAGTETPWWTGRQPATLTDRENLLVRARSPTAYFGTLPVASFPANPFGLHDVHGNVQEWCRDAQLSYLVVPREGDGRREDGSDERLRALRGGSFQRYAHKSRSAERTGAQPSSRNSHVGVRPVRALR